MVETGGFDLDSLIEVYKALLGQFDKNNLDAFLAKIEGLKAIKMETQSKQQTLDQFQSIEEDMLNEYNRSLAQINSGDTRTV